jgi:hypothetical protein
MNIIKDTKQYFLNPSAGTQKNGSFYSDVNFFINTLIKDDPNILYHTITIIHAEIPYSFYIINEYNNKLVLSTGTINIPYGNYNANSLLKYINSQVPTNMVMSFDSSTGKMKLTYNQFFSILSSSNVQEVLGLDYNKTYSSSNNVIQFPYPINVLGTKNLFIKSNVILQNYNSVTQDYVTLSSIPVSVEPYGIILYNNYSNSTFIVKNRILDNLEIQIYDDNNNLVDFNNVEWNITIEVTAYVSANFNNTNLSQYLAQLN